MKLVIPENSEKNASEMTPVKEHNFRKSTVYDIKNARQNIKFFSVNFKPGTIKRDKNFSK